MKKICDRAPQSDPKPREKLDIEDERKVESEKEIDKEREIDREVDRGRGHSL